MVSQSIIPSDKRDINIISRSNSDVNQNDEARKSLNSNSKSSLSGGLTDSDWTELLSVPDKRGVSGAGTMTQSSNRLPSTRSLKKNGKKVSSSGQRLNLSVGDERSEKVGNNGILKSSRKSNAWLESNSGADGDAKASIVGDATPRNSNVQSPNSGGESDQRDSTPTPMFSTVEGVNDIIDGEKLHLVNDSDHSSKTMSISLDRKVGSNGSDMLKMAISGINRSKIGSRTSSSKKKVSSLPSEGESNSETDTTSSSDSESEREREERRKRKQQILAEKAAAKAIEAIKERENLVARLEGEKQSLEKMFEERAKRQVQEVLCTDSLINLHCHRLCILKSLHCYVLSVNTLIC